MGTKWALASILVLVLSAWQGAAFVALVPAGSGVVRTPSTFDRLSPRVDTGLKMAEVTIEFTRSRKTVKAVVGAPLSQVCAKNGIKVKYNCKQGQCAVCSLEIDGRYVKACQGKVPSSRRVIKIKA